MFNDFNDLGVALGDRFAFICLSFHLEGPELSVMSTGWFVFRFRLVYRIIVGPHVVQSSRRSITGDRPGSLAPAVPEDKAILFESLLETELRNDAVGRNQLGLSWGENRGNNIRRWRRRSVLSPSHRSCDAVYIAKTNTGPKPKYCSIPLAIQR